MSTEINTSPGSINYIGFTTFESMFAQIDQERNKILIDRQRKYGPKNIPAFGTLGTVVRMNDKMERLKQLVLKNSGGDAQDETIEDTLMDIANYAQIMIAQLRGWWTEDSCPPLAERLQITGISYTPLPLSGGTSSTPHGIITGTSK